MAIDNACRNLSKEEFKNQYASARCLIKTASKFAVNTPYGKNYHNPYLFCLNVFLTNVHPSVSYAIYNRK